MNTVKDQITELAAYCDISPHIAAVLQRFFLRVTTQDEDEELDNWVSLRREHEQMFDLLCHVNKDGTGAGMMRMLVKMSSGKEPPKRTSRKLVAWRIILTLIVVSIAADYYIKSNPIARWVYGPEGRNYTTDFVETGEEGKTFMLPDKTWVELMPHSKLGYVDNYLLYIRKVRLWGKAKFDVHSDINGPLRIRLDTIWVEVPQGKVTLSSDSTGVPVIQSQTR